MGKTAITQEAWLEQLEACGPNLEESDVLKLVFEDGPSALWDQTVRQMHVMHDGMYKYLTGLFPTREWKDWQGTDELGRIYHSPFIPIDFSIFQRSMQICDPSSANECRTNYCEIPEGGISNLPAMEMYKWGFRTRPICIANIRTSEAAKIHAENIIKERFAVDEQNMNAFYTMALIRMLGHKYVLEFETDVDGNVTLVDNTNPYNPLQGGRFSYLQPLFPAPGNLENIMPMDLRFLEDYGAALARSRDTNYIAKGPRGEPIYELWHPEDWYRQEVIDNAEYIDKTKYLVKPSILPGYSSDEGQKEIVGNWSLRRNDELPRFAESTEGGLSIVQKFTNVNVDAGVRAVHSHRDYNNAPFYMATIIGKDVGEILTRPTLSTGIEGLPINPITGNGDWVYWNEYDPTCNPEKNMPYFKKRYEMGFKMKNPDAGRGFIFRAKKFRLRPINTCDLRPVTKVTPSKHTCDIVTIGCNANEFASNNILDESAGMKKVRCSALVCGDSTSLIYRVSIDRTNLSSISPNQSPLECDCGDTISVFIGDADGDTTKIRDAVIIDYVRPNVINPKPTYILKLASSLAAGECIQYIGCKDATPTVATVVTCLDSEDDESIDEGTVKFILDSTIPCNVGADVEISYYDENGDIIDTAIDGTIVAVYPESMTYVISSEEPDFGCDMKEGQVTVKISCAA